MFTVFFSKIITIADSNFFYLSTKQPPVSDHQQQLKQEQEQKLWQEQEQKRQREQEGEESIRRVQKQKQANIEMNELEYCSIDSPEIFQEENEDLPHGSVYAGGEEEREEVEDIKETSIPIPAPRFIGRAQGGNYFQFLLKQFLNKLLSISKIFLTF